VLPDIVEQLLLSSGYTFEAVSSIEEAMSVTEENIIPMFPAEYFSPKSYNTKKVSLTDNTYSIHHFDGSWLKDNWYDKWDNFLHKIFPKMKKQPFLAIVRRIRILFH
jgi:hypothetical protein